MNNIAKVGEEVIYTGDTSYAIDQITVNLMLTKLIPGSSYEIQGIRRFGYYIGYYIIGGDYYPPKSFISDGKEYLRIKYNLR